MILYCIRWSALVSIKDSSPARGLWTWPNTCFSSFFKLLSSSKRVSILVNLEVMRTLMTVFRWPSDTLLCDCASGKGEATCCLEGAERAMTRATLYLLISPQSTHHRDQLDEILVVNASARWLGFLRGGSGVEIIYYETKGTGSGSEVIHLSVLFLIIQAGVCQTELTC